jgi:predicted TIM-barrel fold metal-dependent hydrolase
MKGMIRANSGDSHLMEPADLWTQRLPVELAQRMPRSEQIDERTEMVFVDGRSFKRKLQWNPELSREDLIQAGQLTRGRRPGMRALDFFRPTGAWDVRVRLQDLDREGVWAEIVYPSIGLWNGLIHDPLLYREGARATNDWLKESYIDVTSRSVPAAEVSVLSVEDAVAEAVRVAEMGFKAINIPSLLSGRDVPNWNYDYWEPFWATVEEAGLVLASHIGSEAKDPTGPGAQVVHGPGGAIANYVETCFGAQRLATLLTGSGVLDRHPDLRLLISEGGATWLPFIADRIEESYRQHGPWVKPKLSRPPSEIVRNQIYASFQHDKSAVYTHTAMGYTNVLWGMDYPHMEGTYGHSQKTLHELFDDVDEAARYRMTRGAFLELFPHVGEPPEDTSAEPG